MLNLDKSSCAIRCFAREHLKGTELESSVKDIDAQFFMVTSTSFRRTQKGSIYENPVVSAFSDNPGAIKLLTESVRYRFTFVAGDGRIRWTALDESHGDDVIMLQTPFAQWLLSISSTLRIWSRPSSQVIMDYLASLGFNTEFHYMHEKTWRNLRYIMQHTYQFFHR